MKPLGMRSDQLTEKEAEIKVVPANLHDVTNQVYDDKLFTMNTLSTEVIGNEVVVQLLASDLVEHVAGNGEKGFWIGVGLHSSLFVEDCVVHVGWEDPVDEELGDPVEDFSTQITNGEEYYTFYFNAGKALSHYQKAYILIDSDTEHWHFVIDFSRVTMKTPVEILDPITWEAMSVQSVRDKYLFGIDLSDTQGNPLPDSLFVHYINASIDYIANLLDITIGKTDFDNEAHDYIRNDYQNWGFIQLFHNPVREVKALRMVYGDQTAMNVPLDWIKLNKLTGQITLFPNAGSASHMIIGQSGLFYGLWNQWNYAPNMWEVDYVAGIDENDPSMPMELLQEAIYKRAAMGILNVWGDLIIGAGIANQSVSIDGVSQSIGTTQSAMFGGASARITEYAKDLKENLLPALRMKFGGLRVTVV